MMKYINSCTVIKGAIKSRGAHIPFSEKLKIIQEGELRYRNEIPPGYKDIEKAGIEKYGDLFIWKDIIKTAYKERAHILFISNDTKEDWWKSEKNEPDDLREELQEEFLETNPFWQIHFLTLSKFFGYLSDELEIGESLSALQLTAQEDAADLLKKLDEKIRKQICETACHKSRSDRFDAGKYIFANDQRICGKRRKDECLSCTDGLCFSGRKKRNPFFVGGRD